MPSAFTEILNHLPVFSTEGWAATFSAKRKASGYSTDRIKWDGIKAQALDLNSNEKTMYNSIDRGNPAALKKAISNTAKRRKVNLSWFSPQAKFLNFRAKRGIEETISQENKMVMAING